ncbi:hypothetical protein [Candidatus Poriferisocius sp.]|uniref:hypothetical protein n=1 Tax=Candidatus Poriferisocius sp. TaxID=3101276 RepID=UPI003B5A3BF2
MDDDRSFGRVNNTDFKQIPRMIRANKHREAVIKILSQDWIVEGVEYVMVLQAVFSSAASDQRPFHQDKLPCQITNDNDQSAVVYILSL